MTKSRQAIKTTLIIIIFTLGSKFLGFIRETLIAAKFGSGMETDTYFIAISATSIITGIITNAISTTSIPILSEIKYKEGKDSKIKHTNNIINVVFIASIVIAIVAWITAPLLVKLLAKGFTGEQFELAVELTRIGLPMIILSGVIGEFTGFLQSEQRFLATAAVGLPFNFVYLFYLNFLASDFGIRGLMIAAVIAVLSQLLIQLPEAKKAGYEYKFIFDIKDEYIKKVITLSGPILIGVAINDIGVVIDKTLASSLVEGSISALNYSNKLIGLINGVFVSAITTVIFPIISKEFNNDNISRMKKVMGYGVNSILLITIPATVGLIVLAKPIVAIAFQRGEFDAIATIMTSQALIFYSLGLVAMALRLLITRVYYSLQDTKTPMVNGAISVGINIALSLILVQFMEHSGLALGTSIANTAATLLMFYSLKKKIGSLGTVGYTITFIKSGLASAIMGVIAYTVYHGLYGSLGISKLYNLISLLVAVGLAVIVYGVLCYIFKVGEVRDIVGRIIKRIRR
ncbi:MAG: murein biosynthesis integral membrane protein MurJ [Tissierella sp.]|nr:murein biosynthesis integral membrane protein MurJ [Tissierella sp.]